MRKKQFLNIFLLCLGGGFLMLGTKLGTIAYVISSISFIAWAMIFINKEKRILYNRWTKIYWIIINLLKKRGIPNETKQIF